MGTKRQRERTMPISPPSNGTVWKILRKRGVYTTKYIKNTDIPADKSKDLLFEKETENRLLVSLLHSNTWIS